MRTPEDEMQAENQALKQRVSELEAQLAQTQRIFERLPHFIYIFDVTNQCNVFINREIATALGYSPDEIQAMGNNLHAQIIHPDDMKSVPQYIAQLATSQDDEVVEVEYRLRMSNGNWCWVRGYDVVFARHDDGSLWQILGTMQDITEYKKMDEQRQLAEFTLNSTGDGVHWLNSDGLQVYVNDALCHNLGYTREELLTMRVSDIDPNFPVEAVQAAWDSLRKQKHSTFDTIHRRKDGSLMEVEISANFLEFNGKEYLCSFIRDVSERKQMEAQLKESEERLRFILEGSGDGAWDTNLVTGETYYSPRYAEMLGYHPDELAPVVETWINSIHPDDAAEVNRIFQGYLSGDIPEYTCEHRLRHKLGTWIWVLSRGQVTDRDAAGQPVRMAGTVSDMTQRRETQEQLRMFKMVVDNASDAIQIINPDGTIIYYNEAHRNLYGCGDSHMGQSIAVIVAPQDQEELPGVLQEIMTEGIWKGQLLHIRQDGTTFPALESCFVTRDNAGNVHTMVGIVRDISELIAVEQERGILQEQVIAAQRDALRELSTPLLPIGDNVLAMPLVGTIDSTRALMVMETLLDGIAAYQADVAIIDITGVKVVDTQVAQAFIRTAQAVQLLGAEVIITGIKPQIAQTLVHLGVDVDRIVTRSTLQAGIAYALNGHRST